MDKAIQHAAPYFDSRALRAELTANFRANGDDPGKTRHQRSSQRLGYGCLGPQGGEDRSPAGSRSWF